MFKIIIVIVIMSRQLDVQQILYACEFTPYVLLRHLLMVVGKQSTSNILSTVLTEGGHNSKNLDPSNCSLNMYSDLRLLPIMHIFFFSKLRLSFKFHPTPRKGGGGVCLTKYNTGRLRPKVQPFTLLYTILVEKVPVCIPFIEKWCPFHIPTCNSVL